MLAKTVLEVFPAVVKYDVAGVGGDNPIVFSGSSVDHTHVTKVNEM